MPVCKHCQIKTDIVVTDETVCPACGTLFSLGDQPEPDPSEDAGDLTMGDSPEATLAFEVSEDDLEDDSDLIELELSDDLIQSSGVEVGEDPLGATMAFDGSDTQSEEDDSFEIELEEGDDGSAGDADVTMGYDDVTVGPNDEPRDEPIDEPSTDAGKPRLDGGPLDLDATIARDDQSTVAPLSGIGLGGPGIVGPKRDDSNTGDSGSHPDGATMQFDTDSSGLIDGGSSQQSGRPPTPMPREITGFSSGQTGNPSIDGDRGSQLLKASGSQTVGPENVRLREFYLGGIQEKTPKLGPGEDADYRFVAGPFAGGMGIVHKARQSTLDRPVAIKQIRADKAESAGNRNSFVSEAVITGQLEHPNIVPVHDLGLGPDGRPFYSMKFVEGQDWDDCIAEFDEQKNLEILIHVAQAIAFAHSRNVIHMDLKPGNIRIGSFGEVQVMDFGLAARLDTGREIKPGGTPMYMAPELALPFAERAAGKKKGEGSSQHAPPGTYSDIYLLGALLFKVVVGKAPHTGKSSFDCLRNAARNKIIPVRRKSELLDIAYKAMATDPADRYPTAGEFIDAIKLYQAHAQSNLIAKRATQELRAAEELGQDKSAEANATYASFSRAQHGFQNALDLWSGNRKAARRLVKARRLYAETAFANGDFDLALSLIDHESSEDEELKVAVLHNQRQRSVRESWFKTLQYATAASLVLALGFIALSVVLGRDAISVRADLQVAKNEMQVVEKQASQAKQESLAAQKEVVRQTNIAAAKAKEADLAAAKAEQASRQADLALDEAAAAKQEATVATREAVTAKQVALLESYNAAIASLRATLNDSGTYAAWKALQALPAEVRQRADQKNAREWVALKRMVDWQSEATEVATMPGPAIVSASADGSRFLVANKNPNGGTTLTINQTQNQPPAAVVQSKAEASQIVASPDGRWAALVGTSLELWDLDRQQPLRLVDREGQPVQSEATCLAFHPTEPTLITGGRGVTERWQIDTAKGMATRTQRDGQWHGDLLSAVGYAADGRLWFSADRSGVINVWITEQESRGAWRYRHAEVAAGSSRITSASMAGAKGKHHLAYGCDDGAVYELAGPWRAIDDPAAATNRFARSEPTGAMAWLADRPEELPDSHIGAVTSVAYADDDQLIVSTGGDAMLVRRPFGKTGRALKTRRRYHDRSILAGDVAQFEGRSVAYTSDEGGRVIRASLEVLPETVVLNPSDQRQVGGVAEARLEPDSGRVVVADTRGYVRSWDDPFLPDQFLKRFVGHDDHRDTRAWFASGNSSSILTITADDHACLWNPQNGLLRQRLDLGDRGIVAVSASGGMVAATDRKYAQQGAPAAVWFQPGSDQPVPLWEDRPRVSAVCLLEESFEGPPILAVGLRDGQVYLWRSDVGRIDLVQSITRPHWRPIRSLAFDRDRQVLYSGDNGGLLTSWTLSGGLGDKTAAELTSRFVSDNDPGMRNAPIERIDLASDGQILTLQKTADHSALNRFSARDLLPIESRQLNQIEIADACFDHSQQAILSIDRYGACRLWHPEKANWSEVVSARQLAGPEGTDHLNGIRRTPAGGFLIYGDGVAQLWEGIPSQSRRTARIVSRAPAVLIADESSPKVRVLSEGGYVDDWNESNKLVEQARLPLAGRLAASCPASLDDQAYLAIELPGNRTALELWDLTTQTKVRTPAPGLPGRCLALSGSGAWLAIATSDQGETRITRFGPGNESELVSTLSQVETDVVDLAISATGEQVVAVFGDGKALYGRSIKDEWQFAKLDREGVTAATFTPDGQRLLVGVASGRVFALSLLLATENDMALTSRTLLSFAGHRDRVTTLSFARQGDQTHLISGDAAGRTIARPF